MLLWRRNGDERMYETSPVADPLPLLFLCLNLILNFTWLFLWSQEKFVASVVALFLIAASGWISLVLFYVRLAPILGTARLEGNGGRDCREGGSAEVHVKSIDLLYIGEMVQI